MKNLTTYLNKKSKVNLKKTNVIFLFTISIFFSCISNLSAQSIAYKLAVVEKNGYVSENDLIVKRFDNLLTQLDKNYVDNKQQIADKTVSAKQILEKKGIKESMINIMEGMNKIYELNNSYRKYNDYLSCYVIFRINGYNHNKSLSLLQESIDTYGIKGVLKKLGID